MTIDVSEALDYDTSIKVTITDYPGSYVNGLWVAGAPVVKKALASPQQPTPQQIELLDGSERVKDVRTFYLNKSVTAGSDDQQASVITCQGVNYKVIHAGDWSPFGWYFAMGAKV